MYANPVSAQLAAIRHAELIADAEAARLARRLRLARRTERHATAPRLRLRLRTATQPAHLCQPTHI